MTPCDFSVIKQDSNILFACCDYNYLKEFGLSLIRSVEETNNIIHVHVLLPWHHEACSPRFDIQELQSYANQYNNCTISYVNLPSSSCNRTFYATARFLYAPDVLKYANSCMIIDTDCVVLGDVSFPETDYALFLRDPLPGTVGFENLGTRVAAGAVYYTRNSLGFANDVASRLSNVPENMRDAWFIDQVVLYEAHEEASKTNKYSFSQIPKTLIDWEFQSESTIWTGKGPRKWNDKKFVDMKKRYDANIDGIS